MKLYLWITPVLVLLFSGLFPNICADPVLNRIEKCNVEDCREHIDKALEDFKQTQETTQRIRRSVDTADVPETDKDGFDMEANTDHDGVDTEKEQGTIPETDNDGYDTEAGTDHDGIDTEKEQGAIPETDNDGIDTEAGTDHDGIDTEKEQSAIPEADTDGFDTEATDHNGIDTEAEQGAVPETDNDGYDTEAGTDHDGIDTEKEGAVPETDNDGFDTEAGTDHDGIDTEREQGTIPETDNDGYDTEAGTDHDGIDTEDDQAVIPETDNDGFDTEANTDHDGIDTEKEQGAIPETDNDGYDTEAGTDHDGNDTEKEQGAIPETDNDGYDTEAGTDHDGIDTEKEQGAIPETDNDGYDTEAGTDNDGIDTKKEQGAVPETDNDGYDTEAATDHDGIDTEVEHGSIPETDNDGYDTEAGTDHDGIDTEAEQGTIPETDNDGYDTEAGTDHDGIDTEADQGAIPETDNDGFDTEANTDHDGIDTEKEQGAIPGTDNDGYDTEAGTYHDGMDTEKEGTIPETDNDGFDTEAGTDHDGIDTEAEQGVIPDTDNDGYDTEAGTDHDGIDTEAEQGAIPETDNDGYDTEAGTDHDGIDTEAEQGAIPETDNDGYDTEAGTDHDGIDTEAEQAAIPETDNDGYDTEAGTDHDGIDTKKGQEIPETDNDGYDTEAGTDHDGIDTEAEEEEKAKVEGILHQVRPDPSLVQSPELPLHAPESKRTRRSVDSFERVQVELGSYSKPDEKTVSEVKPTEAPSAAKNASTPVDGVGASDETEEEEEIYEGPGEMKSKEHIIQILGLDDESIAKDKEYITSVDKTLGELRRVYQQAIKPLEGLYKFRDISQRQLGDAEIFSKPMLLFLGAYSSGKSAMINYLLDMEYSPGALRLGAEPWSSGFTVMQWGEQETSIDGQGLMADWAFSSLQKYGQSFLETLRGKHLNHPLLKKMTIVDTPGVYDYRKGERKFPFNDVCQWFVDRADLIFVVFDPSKLDIGIEMEALFDQLKGRESQVRIIINKADTVKPQELMKVQGTLLWNLSPLLTSSEAPTIYVGSFWSKPYFPGSPMTLFDAQEEAMLQDIRSAFEARIESKISLARRHAVRVRNHAKMVDCYLNRYYTQKSFFSNKKKVAEQIVDNPQEYQIYEGLSTLSNVSRYDLPDPEIYREFFRIHPLWEFKPLASTCSYFKGCPLDKLDVAIAYDLPDLAGKFPIKSSKLPRG